MAAIEMTRQHGLGLVGARQAVQALAERLQHDLKAHHNWRGDSLHFDSPGASGRIDVTEDRVLVSVELSWLLRPARARIERSIKDYLEQCLG